MNFINRKIEIERIALYKEFNSIDSNDDLHARVNRCLSRMVEYLQFPVESIFKDKGIELVPLVDNIRGNESQSSTAIRWGIWLTPQEHPISVDFLFPRGCALSADNIWWHSDWGKFYLKNIRKIEPLMDIAVFESVLKSLSEEFIVKFGYRKKFLTFNDQIKPYNMYCNGSVDYNFYCGKRTKNFEFV